MSEESGTPTGKVWSSSLKLFRTLITVREELDRLSTNIERLVERMQAVEAVGRERHAELKNELVALQSELKLRPQVLDKQLQLAAKDIEIRYLERILYLEQELKTLKDKHN